jgi:hypothetical protein
MIKKTKHISILTMLVTLSFCCALFLGCSDSGSSSSNGGNGNIETTGITLSDTALTLVIGDEKQLEATVLPDNATDKSVTWLSSASAIVSVDDDGLVTALAVTGATPVEIMAFTADGHSATCVVTVIAREIETIEIETPPTKVAYFIGERFAPLGMVVKLNYATGDPVLATVAANGTTNVDGITFTFTPTLTTPLAESHTYITVHLGNSTTITVNQTITVSPVLVESVKLSANTMALFTLPVVPPAGPVNTDISDEAQAVRDASLLFYECRPPAPLTVAIEPASATDKTGLWSIVGGGSSVITVDQDGQVTLVGAGTATVRFTSTCGNKTDDCVVTVSATIQRQTFRFEFEESRWTYNNGMEGVGAGWSFGPRIVIGDPVFGSLHASASGDMLGRGQTAEMLASTVTNKTHGFAVGYTTHRNSSDEHLSNVEVTFVINSTVATTADFGIALGSWDGNGNLNSDTWQMFIDGERQEYISYMGDDRPPHRNDGFRLCFIGTFDLKAGPNTILFRAAAGPDNPDMDYLQITPNSAATLSWGNRDLTRAILTATAAQPPGVRDDIDAYEIEFNVTDTAKYWGSVGDSSASLSRFWGLLR